MKLFYNLRGYSQWIEIRKGEFFKAGCSCPDFLYRKIVTNSHCKHLNILIESLDWDTIREIHDHAKK